MRNAVHCGDNIELMRCIEHGTVDLIYMDPPYNSGADYGEFDDRWESMDAYLEMMRAVLAECRRLLADTGSIYLHCDDTAVHYLKLIMDGVFGRDKYSNDIGWKRSSGKADAIKKFGRITDHILFYTNKNINVDEILIPLDENYVKKAYRNKDERGQWRSDNLTAPGTSNGESGQNWKGVDPTINGNHWRAPKTGKYAEYIENQFPGYLKISSVLERLDFLDKKGFIHWPIKNNKIGMPSLKRYLQDDQGQTPNDFWDDISPVGSKAIERCGYPTQKPIKLLERIIKASSNPGDLVLDPFCGSGTTLVAAKNLARDYIGIDINANACDIARRRLAQGDVNHPFLQKETENGK